MADKGKVKPIETNYKGYRFRSRLEARWAVFFDALRIPWTYEPEGFDLGGMYYLPDFFLPTVRNGLWVEIKGAQASEEEWNKVRRLADLTGHDATIRTGEPALQFDLFNGHIDWNEFAYWGGDGMWDNGYAFCVCCCCEKVGFEFEGRGERVCEPGVHHGCDCHKARPYEGDRIWEAAMAARAARFEYGETPARRPDIGAPGKITIPRVERPKPDDPVYRWLVEEDHAKKAELRKILATTLMPRQRSLTRRNLTDSRTRVILTRREKP